MKIEIEEVIRADDEAAAMVVEARTQAVRIAEEARKTADRFIGEKEGELASALDVERQRVFSEAQARARGILGDADMYVERIREKKEAVVHGLVEQMLEKVTGP